MTKSKYLNLKIIICIKISFYQKLLVNMNLTYVMPLSCSNFKLHTAHSTYILTHLYNTTNYSKECLVGNIKVKFAYLRDLWTDSNEVQV